MQLVNRKTVTRVSALILVLMLILSSVSCLAAASFKKSAAGVKYNGSTFKLGDTTTQKKLKKAFGSSCTVYKVDICTTMPYGGRLYKFSKKGIEVETKYNKNKSEQIVTIKLTKSTVPTIAGVKVGNKVSKLADKYGKKVYKDKYNSNHVYYASGNYILDVYKKNNKITKLVFLIDL